jgi:hypothetical protein
MERKVHVAAAAAGTSSNAIELLILHLYGNPSIKIFAGRMLPETRPPDKLSAASPG